MACQEGASGSISSPKSGRRKSRSLFSFSGAQPRAAYHEGSAGRGERKKKNSAGVHALSTRKRDDQEPLGVFFYHENRNEE